MRLQVDAEVIEEGIIDDLHAAPAIADTGEQFQAIRGGRRSGQGIADLLAHIGRQVLAEGNRIIGDERVGDPDGHDFVGDIREGSC